MRSKSDIKDRLRQASFRHLKRVLSEKLDEVPANCGHNEVFVLDPRSGVELRMCTISSETGERVCDPRVPGCSEMARSCDWFVHALAKDAIKAEWEAMLQAAREGGRDELARRGYGDLAAIMWVLDEPIEDANPMSPEETLPDEGPGDGGDGDDDFVGKKPSLWDRLFGG